MSRPSLSVPNQKVELGGKFLFLTVTSYKSYGEKNGPIKQNKNINAIMKNQIQLTDFFAKRLNDILHIESDYWWLGR